MPSKRWPKICELRTLKQSSALHSLQLNNFNFRGPTPTCVRHPALILHDPGYPLLHPLLTQHLVLKLCSPNAHTARVCCLECSEYTSCPTLHAFVQGFVRESHRVWILNMETPFLHAHIMHQGTSKRTKLWTSTNLRYAGQCATIQWRYGMLNCLNFDLHFKLQEHNYYSYTYYFELLQKLYEAWGNGGRSIVTFVCPEA